MILYVAGAMTGLPEFNRPAFFLAEEVLRSAGYEVLNPARHPVDGRPHADYMRLGIADVLSAHGIATLASWEMSRGARLEVGVAVALGLPIRSVEDWAGAAS